MNSKVNIVEALFAVLIVALFEIIEFLITFLFPGGGELIEWAINAFIWLPVQFWLKIKGMRGDYYVIASLVEFIPLINALPLKTVTLLITIYQHNKKFKNE